MRPAEWVPLSSYEAVLLHKTETAELVRALRRRGFKVRVKRTTKAVHLFATRKR